LKKLSFFEIFITFILVFIFIKLDTYNFYKEYYEKYKKRKDVEQIEEKLELKVYEFYDISVDMDLRVTFLGDSLLAIDTLKIY